MTSPDPTSEPSTPVLREQLIQLIRFNLDELNSANAHHRFEDLCRHFARERIAPNILPATGPVGAGGDRGRDFETFRSFMRDELGPHGGFAGALREDGGAIAFTCTLQRDGVPAKIRKDVAKVMGSGSAVAAIYAFVTAPLAMAQRAALIDEVHEQHGVELEILDGRALAEALTDRDIFWIAEQFLSIPATMRPSPPENGDGLPDWYLEARDRWRSEKPHPTFGEMLSVVEPLSFAASEAEARSDLPFWISIVRTLDSDTSPRAVRQRVRYEVAVAHFRGIGDLRPAEQEALSFLEIVATDETDPARLKDAAGLLGYIQAALSFGRSDLVPGTVAELHDRIRARVRALLASDPPRTRRARLLETLGQLAMLTDAATIVPGGGAQPDGAADVVTALDHGAAGVPDEAVRTLPVIDLEEAMSAWTELAGLLSDAPLYPLGFFIAMLDFFAPRLIDHPDWNALQRGVDDAVERLDGGYAVAERCYGRATQLFDQGRLREALHEAHRAAERWWSGDHVRPATWCLLLVSDIYRRLGMFQAAKHYALAVASIGNSATLDDVAEITVHAMFLASEIDYATGDWISAVEHADIALTAQAVLTAGDDPWSRSDVNDAVSTVGMARRAARVLAPPLVAGIEEVAERYGMLSSLRENSDQLPDWDRDTWLRIADEQMSGRPFADLGERRSFRFAALGTRWRVHATSEYRAARAAERLASAAQILLVFLADKDLCLLPASLDVEVQVADEDDDDFNPVVRHARDRDRWRVTLRPHVPGTAFDEREHFTETLGALIHIVTSISLLPAPDCLSIVTGGFEDGLGYRLALGRPFEELAEIVTPDRYNKMPRASAPAPFPERDVSAAHPELVARTGPGPTYSAQAATGALARRYASMPALVSKTLERLCATKEFGTTIAELRTRGWLDWHIVTAIIAIVGNARLARDGLDRSEALQTADALARARALMWLSDATDDPLVALDRFSTDGLDVARRISLRAYTGSWELSINGSNPDWPAIEQLLDDRYGYWRDDVDHDDPFSTLSTPSPTS